MSVGIYSALSGLKVKERELEVVSHNMANVNTAGFKEESVTFEAILSKNSKSKSNTPFVEMKERLVNFTEGPIATTSNPLDVAIQGDGFFEVQNSNGSFLTRNGSFVLSPEGELMTSRGDRVMGVNGPLKIPQGGIVQISPSGHIKVDGEDVGQIKVSKVSDKKKLHGVGSTLFKAQSDVTIEPDQSSQVFQGKLEQSNTNVMKSLVKLIDISKQYQSYQKIINNQTKVEQEAVASLGKIG